MDDGKQGVTRKQFLLGAVAAATTPVAARASGMAPLRPADGIGSPSRFILLGTAGGPNIRRDRSQPANLLVVDGTPYLFDIGYGCLHQLVAAGFEPRDIGGVFITHLHTDHSIDLASVINFCWSGARTADLPIIGPYGTERLTALGQAYAQEAVRVFTEQFPGHAPITFSRPRDITAPGLVYADTRIKVYAAENSHFEDFAHGRDRSYSYRIECPDRVICLTGDTGAGAGAALAELARGADMLVSEIIDAKAATAMAMRVNHVPASAEPIFAEHMEREHMPPESLGKIATQAGVKLVVLTHIVPGEDNETDMSRYTAGVRRFFNGPVIAGRDMLEL